MHPSKALTIFAVYLTLASAQRCKFPVPFSSKLVNRRFLEYDFCYRPEKGSEIRVFPKTFVYTPLIPIRFSTGNCDEKYVFHLRRGGTDPFIVYFPALKVPRPFADSTSDREKYCKREHSTVRVKYFPTGNTRKMFKSSVRAIVKGALKIRDFGCKENEDGLFVKIEGRAFTNVDVEGVITYLLGVGYQYNFCAEPA